MFLYNVDECGSARSISMGVRKFFWLRRELILFVFWAVFLCRRLFRVGFEAGLAHF